MDSSEFYFTLLWVSALIFGMLFVLRKASASRGKEEATKPGLVYYLAKWIMIFSLLGYLPSLLMLWPPRWMERREQRKQVFQLVESTGGWAKLTEEARLLLATNSPSGLSVSPRYETTFVLPPTIATLKPRDIQLEKSRGLSTAYLQIYGMHSSGGRGQAFYWLYVVDEGSSEDALKKLRSRLNGPRTIHQITNGVFEVY